MAEKKLPYGTLKKLFILIVEEDYTLLEIESTYKYPHTTVHRRLNKELEPDEVELLQQAFNRHKKYKKLRGKKNDRTEDIAKRIR